MSHIFLLIGNISTEDSLQPSNLAFSPQFALVILVQCTVVLHYISFEIWVVKYIDDQISHILDFDDGHFFPTMGW